MRLRTDYSILIFLLLIASVLSAWSVHAQAPQNPFSIGGLEGTGGRPTSGIAAFILGKQAEFTRAMTIAARALKSDWAALWSLLGLALSYGIFHAAGPGHGKAIVAAYVVANENALARGALVAGLAALLQGVVAVALVGTITILLGGTRQMMTSTINIIETVSYAAIALFGFWLLLRKLRSLWYLSRNQPEACDHVHMPGPDQVMRWSGRDAASAIFAAGLRPCSGAILILVFTASQGVLWAGIAAVAAMSIGTAMTTASIAACAVYFKAAAVKLASGSSVWAVWLIRGLEVLAALAVMTLGLLLLMGHWTSVGGA